MCLMKHGCLYYHDTTILIFGFGPNEREALIEAVNDQMAIFHAENWVDILAVPYCIGIINFDQLRSEEQATIIDFFKLYGEMPDTIIYAVNCPIPKAYLPRGFVPCNRKRIGPVESVERRLH